MDAPVEKSSVYTSGLRSIYRDPSQVVLDKAIDHVDVGARGFIEHSPLFVLATGDGRRNDASPRGGPAGFVRVLDDSRIAFGDLTGNNRLDSFSNLIENPGVGMLFMIPGIVETLRVNGVATISTEPELCEACEIDGRVPKVVLVVAVEECFIHCGAAFRRGSVWDRSTWPAEEGRPKPAAILKGHANLDASPSDIQAGLDSYYENGIWFPGGSGE